MFKPHSWKEYGDRVAPEGTVSREMVDFLKKNGSVPMASFRAHYIATGAVDGFTDDQIATALGSCMENLWVYGALEVSKDGSRVTWVG